MSRILGIFIFFGALAYALYTRIVWFIGPQSLQPEHPCGLPQMRIPPGPGGKAY